VLIAIVNTVKDLKILPDIDLDKLVCLNISLENRKLALIAWYSMVSFEEKGFFLSLCYRSYFVPVIFLKIIK